MSSIQKLKAGYLQLYPSDGVEETVANKIEEILQLTLPDDFRKIISFYSGGSLGGISFFAVAHDHISPNIVEETLRLRQGVNLPRKFIVLAEPPESLMVMDTQSRPAVIWCDAVDVVRLHDQSFMTAPQTWNSYEEFFSDMLEEELEE